MAIAVSELRSARPERSLQTSDDFDEFYRAYLRRVRAFVRRKISDREVAAEVVQDTFLRAHTHFDRLDPSRSAWPWLATVASNLCTDALRRGGAATRTEAPEFADAPSDEATVLRPEVLDWAADPADAFDRSVRSQAVLAALAEVPLRQRQVLVLKDAEGWTAEEIARLDGASIEGVKSLVRRARTAFRSSYDRIADERGVRSAFGLVLAPLARLRTRAATAVGNRFALLGAPLMGLPLDASQILGAAALSGLLFVGAVPAAADMMPIVSTGSAVTEAPAGGAPAATATAPPEVTRTEVKLATPVGAPAASLAGASLMEEGEARTLEGIVAAKVGDAQTDSESRIEFDCDVSEVRAAACDAVESAPDLNGD